MLTCQDVSRLISDAHERRLPLLTRVRLRMHLALCRPCAALDEQISFLETTLGEYRERALTGDLAEAELPADVRDRLERALDEAVTAESGGPRQ